MVKTTDTSERGLERLICTALTGHPCDPPKADQVAEPRAGYGGVGWSCGSPHDYNREFCVDRVQLAAFLRDTQPDVAESLALDADGPTQRKFLARLQGEISKRGTIDVLRHGVRHGAHNLDLFYGTPSAENEKAKQRFEQNRFTVVSAASLQPGRDTARARHRAFHQRPSPLHFRAQEPPYQADGERCHGTVQEGPQSAREALRVRPLRRPLRGG